MALDLRLAPSGPPIVAENDGDILIWSASEQGWDTGPGGAGALSGDTNGPAGDNRTTSLTGAAGGDQVPLDDMSAAVGEPSVVLRDQDGGGGYFTAPLSSIPFVAPTEYDHLISSRADLVAVVAPAAGEFVLPAGSYFLKADVTLNAGEYLVVDNADVLWAGGGEQYQLTSGDPDCMVVRNGGKLILMNTQLRANNAAGAFCLSVSGDNSVVRSSMCNFNGSGAVTQGVSLKSGAVYLSECIVSGGIDVTGGSFNACQTEFLARSSGHTVKASGSVDSRMALESCKIDGGASGAPVHLNNPLHDCFFSTCAYEATADTYPCVWIEEASSVQIIGGRMVSSAPSKDDGVRFDGDMLGAAQILGVSGQTLDDFVKYQSGTQSRVIVSGCETAGDVFTGIDWPTANIPTMGLVETDNAFNQGPGLDFVNHNANDARVMRRANLFSGGLASETSLVP